MLEDNGRVDGVDLVDGPDPLLAGQRRIAELEAEVGQLRQALVHRQLYGVVTGVLATRYGLSPERAWEFVVRLSQQCNLKVQVVARVLQGRFFDRLAAEDEEFAAQLDAQMSGQLGPLTPGPADGKADGDLR